MHMADYELKNTEEHPACRIVQQFVEQSFELYKKIDAWIALDDQDWVAPAQELYTGIAKQCLVSSWQPGARSKWGMSPADSFCTETVERVELPSPQTAFVFTHDPGPPDERWRYEVIVENGEWRIARKFQIEFDGKPWDNEEIL